MSRRIAVCVTLSLVTVGTTSCIEDPTAVDDQFGLTQEVAELLGLTVWRHALEVELDVAVGGGESAAAWTAPQRVPETFTTTDTTVAGCTLGGEIERILGATATIDVEADEVRLDATLTLDHDACREEIEGQTFSFYGARTIVASVTSISSGDAPQVLSGSIEGATVVITEGVPLLCEVAVEAGPGEVVGDSITWEYRGTFCGQVMDSVVTEAVG